MVRQINAKLLAFIRKPYVVYAAAALIIVPELLRPGFILATDMIFVPHMPLPADVTASYLFYALFHFLGIIIPTWLIQKVMLFLILSLSGYGAHRMVQFVNTRIGGLPYTGAYYFAGLLYMINPFTYSRFITGQFAVLLGYMLLPFLIMIFWRWLEAPTAKKSLALCLLLLGISIVSIHTLGLVALLLLGLAAAYIGRRQPIGWWRAVGLHGAAITAACIVLSSYWLLPLLLGTGKTANTIAGFTAADRQAFQTDAGDLGLPGNILVMHGFWADSENLYLLPQDLYGWWLIPIVIIWGLVLAGMRQLWRRDQPLALAFTALIGLATILAIGTASTIIGPLNEWLATRIPFFAGYREPQKFIALIALSYSLFAAYGAGFILSRLSKAKEIPAAFAPICLSIILILPVLSAPLMPGNFSGQLASSNYPADWHALNERFEKDPSHYKVLFLPWHFYMRFHFAEGVIANPADSFFKPEVVINTNPEFGGASSYKQSDLQKYVNNTILPQARKGEADMGKSLQSQGVKYVILAKEFDYKTYQFLDRQRGLEMIADTAHLRLYLVRP